MLKLASIINITIIILIKEIKGNIVSTKKKKKNKMSKPHERPGCALVILPIKEVTQHYWVRAYV